MNNFAIWTTILSNDSALNEEEPLAFSGSVISKLSPASHSSSLSSSLVNPMYKLKSLLYPPKVENYPLSTVLQCSSCMCDIQLWDNLYLNRTLEGSHSSVVVSGNDISLISVPTGSGAYSNASTPSSKSPGSCETAFIYSLKCGEKPYRKSGRDPIKELKVVELLLASLSTSTRYNRNNQGATSSTASVFKDRQVNRSQQSFNPSSAKYRKNPFTNI